MECLPGEGGSSGVCKRPLLLPSEHTVLSCDLSPELTEVNVCFLREATLVLDLPGSGPASPSGGPLFLWEAILLLHLPRSGRNVTAELSWTLEPLESCGSKVPSPLFCGVCSPSVLLGASTLASSGFVAARYKSRWWQALPVARYYPMGHVTSHSLYFFNTWSTIALQS